MFCIEEGAFFPSQTYLPTSIAARSAESQGNSLRQRAAKAARAERIHATRLASAGWEGESAKMSLRDGSSPSTLAVSRRDKDNTLAAKERAAAKGRSTDHRESESRDGGSA